MTASRATDDARGQRREGRRLSTPLLTLVGLVLLASPFVTHSDLLVGREVWAAVEAATTLLALATASVFLIAFRSTAQRLWLMLALAIMAGAATNFSAAVLAAIWPRGYRPAGMPAVLTLERAMYCLLLLWALRASAAQSPTRGARRTIVSVCAVFPAVSLVIIAIGTLWPQGLWWFSRWLSPATDVALLPALGAGAWLYTRRGVRDQDPMLGWVAISIGACGLGQLALLASDRPGDAAFLLAQLGSLLGYLLPLVAVGVVQVQKVHTLGLLERDLSAQIGARDSRLHAIDEHNIVIETDEQGRITWVNAAAVRLSGYQEHELVGRDHRLLDAQVHRKRFFVAMQRALNAGRLWAGDVCLCAKDGERYWLQTTIVPMRDAHGRPVGYLAVCTNVTSRIGLQAELEQKNAELEGFVYIASHDLKSPLVTVQGFVGMLRQAYEQGRTDRFGPFIQHIEDGVSNMQEVIKDLLEISRVGRVVWEREAIDVAVVARQVLTALGSQVEACGAMVTVAEPIPAVCADRVRVVQALQNYIANALKYGRPENGPVEIEVGGWFDGTRVIIYVRDNGPGIEAQYHEKVFELFQRLKTEVEGTGIGLAIVKRIAEVNGGAAWVESAPGQGATFYIALPPANNKQDSADKGAGASASDQSHTKSKSGRLVHAA